MASPNTFPSTKIFLQEIGIEEPELAHECAAELHIKDLHLIYKARLARSIEDLKDRLKAKRQNLELAIKEVGGLAKTLQHYESLYEKIK